LDVDKLSVSADESIMVPASPVGQVDAEFQADDAKFRWVPIRPKDAEDPRPIPEITAEILKDMDRLCNWLHDVQRVHLAMSRLRADRRQAQDAADQRPNVIDSTVF
jgi:hypothetical protein